MLGWAGASASSNGIFAAMPAVGGHTPLELFAAVKENAPTDRPLIHCYQAGPYCALHPSTFQLNVSTF